MLAHLRLAGVLDSVGGVILCGFTGAESRPDRPTRTLDQVFDDYFGKADYPVIKGWNYGHFPVKVNMPIGVRARLVAEPGAITLTVLESLRL